MSCPNSWLWFVTMLVSNQSSSLSVENPSNLGVLTQDEARCDICACGFWWRGQDAFFDVSFFYPNMSSYCNEDLASLYKLHKNAKKREYGERVWEDEHAVVTPLVLSTCGGMLCETTTFYKKVTTDLAAKRKVQYSEVLGWLRCRISFPLLQSAIMVICESRSSSHSGAPADILLASRDGDVPRLLEDIENAGNCDYLTITYIITLFVDLKYLIA